VSAPPRRERLWSRDYVLTLFTSFSLFASIFYLTTPIPEYVDGLGGEAWEVGLVTGAFAVVPLGLRPYVGRWSDRGGRKRLIRVGLVIMALSLAAMAASEEIPALLALRIVQGIGISMVPTSAMALIAAIVPPSRRGEGVGFFGVAAGAAQMTAPVAGAWFASQWGFGAVFVSAGVIAAAGLLSIQPVAEPPTSEEARNRRGAPLLPRRSLFPSAVFFATTLAFTAVLIFLPLLGRERGLGEVAFFFTVHGAASLIARPLGGRISDRIGRVPVVTFGLISMTVAMLLLASAHSFEAVLVAGFFSGAGLGSTQTGLFALALDRVPYEQQGGATAVMQLAWDVAGIAAGVGFGVVATIAGVPAVFWSSAVVVAFGVLALHAGRASGLTAVEPRRPRPAA
jgi:MFS family permease